MVKSLQSKMLMCDTAHEQKAQTNLRNRKLVMTKEIDKHWEEMEKQQMVEYDEKMQKKLEVEYKGKIENAKAISDQLEEFKLSYIKQLKEEMLEGELIKRQAEEDLEREKGKEIAKMKRGQEMKS